MRKISETCPVSVILPCYNAADTVAMSIKSAAFQTMPPAEIIVMDDGSTDDSARVIGDTIKEIQDLTPSNIVFVACEQYRGVYPVRNDALRQSTQPYLAFLDSDDYWHPQKLAIQYAYFKKDPELALSCHGVIHRNGTPHTLAKFDEEYEAPVKTLKHATILFRSVMITISIMIKKPENLYFDESKKRGSDMLFWFEIVLRGGKAIWIRENMSFTAKPLYGGGGLSGSIWKSEMAQQENLRQLWKRGYISRPYCLLLRAFSFTKMLRRYCIYGGRILARPYSNPNTINPPIKRRRLFLFRYSL